MPDLLETALPIVLARLSEVEALGKNENRSGSFNVSAAYVNDSSRIGSPMTQSMMSQLENTTTTQTKTFPVLNNNRSSINVSRSAVTCDLSGTRSESNKVQASLTKYSATIEYIPAQNDSNAVDVDLDIAHMSFQALERVAQEMNVDNYAFILQQATQTAGDLSSYYPFAGTAFEVPANDNGQVLSAMKAMYLQEDFTDGPIQVLHSYQYGVTTEQYGALGPGDGNLAYLLNGLQFWKDNIVAADPGFTSKLVTFQPGTFGWAVRVPFNGRTQQEVSSIGKSYTSQSLPLPGIGNVEMEVSAQTTCEDLSANTDLVMEDPANAIVKKMQFHTNIYRIATYNSDRANNVNPVMVFNLS